MIEKECKWLKDEFCVNDKCPMCADYCPVAQYHGVCKYEELVDVPEKMTVGKCFMQALTDAGIEADKPKMENAMNRFRELVNSISVDPVAPDLPDVDMNNLSIGQILYRCQVEDHPMWRCKSFSGEPYNNACCYISNDEKWVIRFNNGCIFGKLAPWYGKEEFVVGKQVHVGAIGESREWEYIGEKNSLATYRTRDKLLLVEFRRDSDWGTIMLNREAVDAAKARTVPALKEGDEVRLMDVYGDPNWQEMFCKDNIAEFRSKDGTLGCTFTEESTTAIIYRRNV